MASGREHAAQPGPQGEGLLGLLALAAGCVDAVSYLGLGHVLTAAMTGNTVLLGLAIGQADLAASLRSTVALVGFLSGVVLGASILRRNPTGLVWSPAMIAALAVELLILVSLAAAWQVVEGGEGWLDIRFPLIAAAGSAMGVQSAIAYRIGVSNVATTYVTGTLTSMGTRLVHWLARQPARDDRISGAPPSWVPASVWLAYGCGAAFAGATHLWWSSAGPGPAAGAIAEARWPSAALLFPIVIVAAVMLIVAVMRRRLPSDPP